MTFWTQSSPHIGEHTRRWVSDGYELFAILWECDKEHRISHDIKARFLFFPEKVFGNYFDDSCGAYQIEYTRNAFINSAIKALKDLCHYVIKDGVCYYRNFTVETAEALLLGIDDLSILTITDFTLHFSCCFTKLLHSLFITLLNNFTM